MQIMTEQETAQWLRDCGSAAILIHQSPDGDCIGSGYALLEVLRQLGKSSQVLCSDPIPERYAFLRPGTEPKVEHPDCVISVDVADAKLLGSLQKDYGDRVDLCMDHHISNTGYAARLCLDGQAPAACQVLYEVIRQMPEISMTEQLVTCLYTGLATDTGCFQHNSVSARTHEVAAELMRFCPQVPYGQINRNLFVVKSLGRLQMERMLLDQMQSYFDGACMLICVTQADLKRFGVDESELDSVASFPIQVEGAQVGVTLKEREPNVFKVSMRSAGAVNVSQICEQLGGGGHVCAAGCLVKGTPDEVREKLLSAIGKGLSQA